MSLSNPVCEVGKACCFCCHIQIHAVCSVRVVSLNERAASENALAAPCVKDCRCLWMDSGVSRRLTPAIFSNSWSASFSASESGERGYGCGQSPEKGLWFKTARLKKSISRTYVPHSWRK